jgi:hypothetical protein
MDPRTLPARAGLDWLRDALRLFRRQAFAFTALVILYLFGLMLLASVPLAGLAVAALLVPFGTLGLTAAGREAEANRPPLPALLLEGFRNPAARLPLARLGLLQAGLMLLVNLVVGLLAADAVERWTVVDGQIDPASLMQNIPWDALLAGALLYAPALMATWYSPMLIGWTGMPVGKAVFYSFFACWRNRGAFIVLGLLLFGLIAAAAMLLGQLLALLGLRGATASLLMTPLALVMSSIAYATLWPMWRSVFGAAAPAAAIEAPRE